VQHFSRLAAGRVSTATRGEREDDDGRSDGCRGRKRCTEPHSPPSRPASCERGRGQLGVEPRIETRRDGSRERLLAELGERPLHGRVLAGRHLVVEAEVVHAG
jgi:hypothetical protein